MLKIFADAGRGLAAAHEKNLVHRDFKPDNVMIGADGHVRVMDFGLARSTAAVVLSRGSAPVGPAPVNVRTLEPPAESHLAATREMSPVGWTSGSPADVAADVTVLQITDGGDLWDAGSIWRPSSSSGHDTDARTNQFSFCVALHEALYRIGPFDGETMDRNSACSADRCASRPRAAGCRRRSTS